MSDPVTYTAVLPIREPTVAFLSGLLAGERAARALHEDTLARLRRVLGEDHPDTLTSANNLAADLAGLERKPQK